MAKGEKITIKLNTLECSQWHSPDGSVRLTEGSKDGSIGGITEMTFPKEELDKLPKRDLAIACAHNIIDIEGWDALEWLKVNKKNTEPPKPNTKRDLIFSLAPNETMWASKDRSIILSIFPTGKTSIKVKAGDHRMGEFLKSVRAGRLMIIDKEEDAVKKMDKNPEIFIPEREEGISIDAATKAKTWLKGTEQEIVDLIRNRYEEKDEREDTEEFIQVLKSIVLVENREETPRKKLIQVASRTLIDLGEFVELPADEIEEDIEEEVNL
jgi:hypothetical protein